MKLRIADCAAQGRVAGVVITKSDRLSLLHMLWQWIQGKVEETRMFIVFVLIMSSLNVQKNQNLL